MLCGHYKGCQKIIDIATYLLYIKVKKTKHCDTIIHLSEREKCIYLSKKSLEGLQGDLWIVKLQMIFIFTIPVFHIFFGKLCLCNKKNI